MRQKMGLCQGGGGLAGCAMVDPAEMLLMMKMKTFGWMGMIQWVMLRVMILTVVALLMMKRMAAAGAVVAATTAARGAEAAAATGKATFLRKKKMAVTKQRRSIAES